MVLIFSPSCSHMWLLEVVTLALCYQHYCNSECHAVWWAQRQLQTRGQERRGGYLERYLLKSNERDYFIPKQLILIARVLFKFTKCSHLTLNNKVMR